MTEIVAFLVGASLILFLWIRNNEKKTELTPEQIDNACIAFRGDFDLLKDDEKNFLRFDAENWLKAWETSLLQREE